MRYNVITLDENGKQIARLNTDDINIACDYMCSEIDRIWYDKDNTFKIGLWDEFYGENCDGGYYAMCIHDVRGNTSDIVNCFELFSLRKEYGNVSLFDAREIMIKELEGMLYE